MSESPLTPDLAGRFVIDAEPWLSCDDCFNLVDGFVERVVTDSQPDDPRVETAMRAHLRGCAACYEEAAGLLELVATERGIDRGAAAERLTAR